MSIFAATKPPAATPLVGAFGSVTTTPLDGETTTSLPVPTSFGAAAASDNNNGIVNIFGGWDGKEPLKGCFTAEIATAESGARSRSPFVASSTLPSARYGAVAGRLNGAWFVTGGYSTTRASSVPGPIIKIDTSSTSIYTAWTEVVGMHTPRRFTPAGVVAGETFVVCGGSDGAVIHNSCEMFVPTKKPATSARAGKKIAQPLNGATPFGAASVAAAGLFGAPAGLDSTTTFTPIRAGSTALGRWQMLPPMPTARTGCTACYVGDAVLVIGGEDGSGTPMSTVEALDMKRRKWVTLPSLKVARTGAGCCVVGNVVYVVGGAVIPSDASSNSIPTASIEILDLSTAYDVFPDTPSVNGQRRPTKWYTGPPMVSARAYLAVTVNDGVVYAMGGVDANGVTVDAVEILDTVTGKEKGQNLPVRTLLSGGGSTTKEVFTRGKETNDEGNKVTCGYTVYTKANWFCGKEFKTQTGKQLRCVASTGSVWSSQGCPSCKRFEANLKPSLLKGLKDFTFKLPSKEEMEINAAKFPSPPRNWDTENEKEKEVPVEVEAENPNPGWLGWEFGSPSTLRNSDGSGAQVIEEEVRVDVTEVSADYPSFCTTNGYDVPCTVYAKLYDTPRVGTCEAYREFAEEKWMRIVEREHPGGGNGYGNSYRGNNQYGFVTMENFWNAHVFPAFKDRDISYKDVLVVHGNKADGFCFDAEAGAMIAFGEPSAENGYGYCRGGGNALKRLHIYILLK